MIYTVSTNQHSLFDVAVEVYGDVAGVFWLLEDNPAIVNLTDPLRAGQVLAVRPVQINARQVDYLRDFTPIRTIDIDDQPTGVGYWFLNEYEVQ